jgi:hypothetical protein
MMLLDFSIGVELPENALANLEAILDIHGSFLITILLQPVQTI